MIPASVFLAAVLSFQDCNGTPDYWLGMPAQVALGQTADIILSPPAPSFQMLFFSLGEGPVDFPFGRVCLDFPAIFQKSFIDPLGGQITLSAPVPWDDRLVGLKIFAQSVGINWIDPSRKYVSNQACLEILPGVEDSFADFTDLSKIQLNGNAVGAGNVLRVLSQGNYAGSAFYKTPITIGPDTSFSTRFTFNIHGIQPDGGDGMTFMIQGNDPFQLGSAGNGLGYEGIWSSFAVEIDNYQQLPFDITDNELAILFQGDVLHHYSVWFPSFDLEDGNDHTLWVDYDGATNYLQVYLAETASDPKPCCAILGHPLDLFGAVGATAYFGFSAGAGGFINNHDVINWEFRVW